MKSSRKLSDFFTLPWIKEKFGEKIQKTAQIIENGKWISFPLLILGLILSSSDVLGAIFPTVLICISLGWWAIYVIWRFSLLFAENALAKEQKQKAHDEALKAELVQAVREELAKERAQENREE